jgi:hypothetical protein
MTFGGATETYDLNGNLATVIEAGITTIAITASLSFIVLDSGLNHVLPARCTSD